MAAQDSPPRHGVFASLADPVVIALGLTQTIGYGTLYYGYGVLAPVIARDLDVPLDWFFAAFTIGLLLGGVVAPLSGRELDRRGARSVMRLGSALAGLALLLCAITPNIWLFSLALVFAEMAACLVLYEAAFAGLTQIHRMGARPSITALTLIAGFASTVFWPLTQWMLGAFGWRWTLALFGLANILICAPLHHIMLRGAKPLADGPTVASGEPEQTGPALLTGDARRRALILFALAVCVSSLVYSAVPVHMLRIIENEGFTPEKAALIAMLMGPMQVVARLIDFSAGKRLDALMTGRIALIGLCVSLALLMLASGTAFAAVAFALVYGASQGLITIARGTVPLQLFGAAGYGALVGRITGLRFIFSAAGPLVFAAASTRLSMDAALGIMAGAALFSLIAFQMIRAPGRP
jgi:MFS family permease